MQSRRGARARRRASLAVRLLDPLHARDLRPGGHDRHAPQVVGGRHSGLDGLVQPDDPLHQLLGPRRAARDVDVDRDDLVDRLEDRVVVEHPARARAGAHRDHPLRLEHLVVDLPERRRHLVRDAAGDDQQVGLARRGAERLHPEACDVVARARRSTSSRSHSTRARRCPATSTSSAPRRRPWTSVDSPTFFSRSFTSVSNFPGPFVGQSSRSECSPMSRSRLSFSIATRALPSARCTRRPGAGSPGRRGTRRTRTRQACAGSPRAGRGTRSRCRRG